jgi:hypothetical protein
MGDEYRMIQIVEAPAFCFRVAEKGEESGNLIVTKVPRMEVWACDPYRSDSCFSWSFADKKIRPHLVPKKCVAPRMETEFHDEAVLGSSVGVHPCHVSRTWRWRNKTDRLHKMKNSTWMGMMQTNNTRVNCVAVHGLYNGAKVELAPCTLERAVEVQWLKPDDLAAELDAMHATDASVTHYKEESRELGKIVNQELRKEFGPNGVPDEAKHWDQA